MTDAPIPSKRHPHDWGEAIGGIARCKRCEQLTFVYGRYKSSDTHNCPVPPDSTPEPTDWFGRAIKEGASGIDAIDRAHGRKKADD